MARKGTGFDNNMDRKRVMKKVESHFLVQEKGDGRSCKSRWKKAVAGKSGKEVASEGRMIET
jgi:hypothetical protein